MSVLNETGEHRLVYKAQGFATGKTVTAYIWSPSLVKSAQQAVTEVSDGMYYLDYTFSATGTYFGVFYEGGVAMATGTWRVIALASTVADAVLSRGVDNVEDTADTHSLCTIVLATLESSISGTTWTIKKTGGTTFTTKTLTKDADAEPITGVT